MFAGIPAIDTAAVNADGPGIGKIGILAKRASVISL